MARSEPFCLFSIYRARDLGFVQRTDLFLEHTQYGQLADPEEIIAEFRSFDFDF